jgi:hypothetical protein
VWGCASLYTQPALGEEKAEMCSFLLVATVSVPPSLLHRLMIHLPAPNAGNITESFKHAEIVLYH